MHTCVTVCFVRSVYVTQAAVSCYWLDHMHGNSVSLGKNSDSDSSVCAICMFGLFTILPSDFGLARPVADTNVNFLHYSWYYI